MKLLGFVFFMVMLVSCGKEDMTPTTPINDTFDPGMATLLKSGTFVNKVHVVSGTAALYEFNGNKVLLLDPFMTENGPDLKVYLSLNEAATSFINLGNLKSTTGKQTYDIPANTDIPAQMYVHIWCQQFSVNFGQARVQ